MPHHDAVQVLLEQPACACGAYPSPYRWWKEPVAGITVILHADTVAEEEGENEARLPSGGLTQRPFGSGLSCDGETGCNFRRPGGIKSCTRTRHDRSVPVICGGQTLSQAEKAVSSRSGGNEAAVLLRWSSLAADPSAGRPALCCCHQGECVGQHLAVKGADGFALMHQGFDMHMRRSVPPRLLRTRTRLRGSAYVTPPPGSGCAGPATGDGRDPAN